MELTAAAVAAASSSAAEQYAAAAVAAAGVAAPAAVLANGVAERLQEMLDAGVHVDDEHGDGPGNGDDSRRVAFDWWKEIPKPMRKNQSTSHLEQLGKGDGIVLNQRGKPRSQGRYCIGCSDGTGFRVAREGYKLSAYAVLCFVPRSGQILPGRVKQDGFD
jgi:hypothetical protein